MGFPGGVAKPGYLNDYGKKGDRKIQADPDRFELVKQMFGMFLSGKHSVRALLKYADEVLGLKTIQRKKEGGKPLPLSRIYNILKDPFYAGYFYGKNENGELTRYEVHDSVPRMITEEQYWQIQSMLGRKGAPRPSVNKHMFPYTGRTRCGNCSGSVVAEHKHQLICSNCKLKFAYRSKDACPRCDIKIERMENATYLHYIFYHCSKRRTPECPERSVHESDIDSSLAEYVENNLAISETLSKWCIENIDALTASDKKNEYERKATWERQKAEKQKEYDQLVQMRMKGLIDDDMEFLRLKTGLKADISRIDDVLNEMGDVNAESVQRAKETFSLIVGLSEAFRTGTFEEKQEALSVLGSNLTLSAKKLNVRNKEVFSIITKGLLQARQQNPAFEPRNYQANKDQNSESSSSIQVWAPRVGFEPTTNSLTASCATVAPPRNTTPQHTRAAEYPLPMQ